MGKEEAHVRKDGIVYPVPKCQQCGKVIVFGNGKPRGTRYCSGACKRILNAKAYREENPASNIPSNTVGAMNELVVCADLLKKGFHVFRALSPSCPCDLSVLRDGKHTRIEVTTGHKTVFGKLYFPTKDHKKYDTLAVVVGAEIIYIPPFSE